MNDFRIHTQKLVAEGHDPKRYVMVIHGVFGSGANWRLFMRRVVAERPDWGAVLVDLRGHGMSQGATAPHTIEACASDLASVVETFPGEIHAVVGHSLGGKIALALCRALGTSRPLSQLWTLDSNPGVRPPSPDAQTFRVLSLLEGLPATFESRPEFVRRVKEGGFPSAIAAWLAMNVRPRSEGGYTLRLQLAAIRSVLEDYYRTDYWAVLGDRSLCSDQHVVIADKSEIWSGAEVSRVASLAEDDSSLRVHHLAQSGHWVHVDAPDAVQKLLVDELPR